MTSYDDDCGAPTWELIEERWVTARKPHPCNEACTGIQAGESYHRVAGRLDGEFTLTQTCGYCHAGHPRPGTPEAAAEMAEVERLTREDEADYLAAAVPYVEVDQEFMPGDPTPYRMSRSVRVF